MNKDEEMSTEEKIERLEHTLEKLEDERLTLDTAIISLKGLLQLERLKLE